MYFSHHLHLYKWAITWVENFVQLRSVIEEMDVLGCAKRNSDLSKCSSLYIMS